VTANDELFDRPAAMRLAAVERLDLTGEDRIAGLVTGAGYPNSLEPIAAALRNQQGPVLDLGAGLGAASAWLSERAGIPVVGVEPEGRAAALGRRAFPGLPMACGSADAVPVRSGSCGGVVMLGVLSLVADLDAALGEALRVVRPGGVVGVTDLCLAEGAVLPSGANVFRSSRRLAQALEARGCTVTDVWGAPGTLDTRWGAITKRVDDEITARHEGTDALRAWNDDREHLHDLIVEEVLEIATIIALAPAV
jgi:SAM-dependent methyltransferase